MIEIDKEYIVNIESLGYEGEGVAKIDGFPIFIQGALKGEKARIKITKKKKKFADADVLEILEQSDSRIAPKCSFFEKCGGCNFQHLTYAGQLDFKYDRVKDCIGKIAGLDKDKVNYTLGMKDFLNYRNKVQLPVAKINGKTVIGFYSEKTHDVIDIESCMIQPQENSIIVKIVKDWMIKYNIEPANRDGAFYKNGIIRHIIIRKAFKTNEIMIILVSTKKKVPKINELIEDLKSEITSLKSVIININDSNTSRVYGNTDITAYGRDYIEDYIGSFKFRISPLSFFQVNPVQTEVLYKKALEYADLNGTETVFDAYCGIGTISLFLSQKAKKVYGVEIVDEAIKSAGKNAEINEVKNAEFFTGKSEKVIPNLIDKGVIPDVVVVDPPRKGCDRALLDSIIKAEPKKIVYVSCDPSTLARDLKYLCSEKYKLCEVQPVDMFPMTKHVESVAKLVKE